MEKERESRTKAAGKGGQGGLSKITIGEDDGKVLWIFLVKS